MACLPSERIFHGNKARGIICGPDVQHRGGMPINKGYEHRTLKHWFLPKAIRWLSPEALVLKNVLLFRASVDAVMYGGVETFAPTFICQDA